MSEVGLSRVSIDLPIYSGSSLSLRKRMLGAGGKGRFGEEHGVMIVRALRDVSLSAGPGDRIGIVGRNGAGKTTLLRVLAKVFPPTRGRVAIRGAVASLLDITAGFDPGATGVENVRVRGMIMGLNGPALKRAIEDVVAFAELGEFIEAPIRVYSTGMLMRLAFGLATASKASILVMDEWLSAGDQAFMEKAKRRVETLVDSAEILFLASHDLDLVRNWCTKGIWLEQGRVRAVGPIDEIVSGYERDTHAAA